MTNERLVVNGKSWTNLNVPLMTLNLIKRIRNDKVDLIFVRFLC